MVRSQPSAQLKSFGATDAGLPRLGSGGDAGPTHRFLGSLPRDSVQGDLRLPDSAPYTDTRVRNSSTKPLAPVALSRSRMLSTKEGIDTAGALRSDWHRPMLTRSRRVSPVASSLAEGPPSPRRQRR